MTKYERYTSKDGATLTMSQWGGNPAELELYRKLAELEDKIENGTLVELPYKVGDTVYTVEYSYSHNQWFVAGHEVAEISIDKNDIYLKDYYGVYLCNPFLTKPEAEAKLRELKEKENEQR